MKTEPLAGQLHRQPCAEQKRRARRRQRLRLLFAVILACFAGYASAEEMPATIQYDGATSAGPSRQPGAVMDPGRVGGGALTPLANTDSRPAYVQMSAYLANFDADAAPDGWMAEIVLRDRRDRPVQMRARATFELTPRIPSPLAGPFIDPGVAPIRWSIPVTYDDDGIARFKLPIPQSQRLLLGWQVARFPRTGNRSRADISYNNSSRQRTFATVPVRDVIGIPNVGQIRVRVSVPTQGLFEADALVRIRPPVLVDTPWPYR